MSMIILNYVIEQVSECMIWVVRTGIESNTRVSVFASWEDSLLKCKMMLVSRILQLSPDISREIFAEKTLGAWWENWESVKIVWSFKVRAYLNILLRSFFLSLFKFILIFFSTLVVYWVCSWYCIFRRLILINEFRILRNPWLVRYNWLIQFILLFLELFFLLSFKKSSSLSLLFSKFPLPLLFVLLQLKLSILFSQLLLKSLIL